MATLRPTFSESWYRVADLKAKLRPSAQISRQYYRGERWYVVRDPAGNQFHRLSAPAYRFVGLLDGKRTVAEAWDLVGGQLADDAPTQNEVIQILSQLHSANLLESDVTPDAQVLLRRHKQMVKRQWQGRLMNILFPRIPLWDVDSFLVRWMPVMRVFLSNFGAILWLLVVGAAVWQLAPEWSRLVSSASDAIAPGNWPFLWATFVIIKLIHELGHGFACRRFGGEVHELGIMFLVLVPAPYVDASTAWAFQNKWARIFVGAGGMIFELFVAAIMAFVWLNTAQGHLMHQLAYNAMLVASVSTILFNANPLLRYDGYYMLADWLEIPNLRYRSTEYTMGLIKRHLFKVKMAQPLPPVGQRFWLFFYAIASSIYRTIIGIFIILMVWEQVPVLGVLMALGGVATWILVPIFKTTKYLLIDAELHRKRARATAWVLGAAAAAVILIGFIPVPLGLYTVGVAQPIEQKVLYAKVPGRVQEIRAHEGQMLKKGDPIIVCVDERLQTDIATYKAKIKEFSTAWKAATAIDQTQREVYYQKMIKTQEQLDRLQQQADDLIIRAPFDGMLIAPRLHELKDKRLKSGEEVAIVANIDQIKVVTVVDQDDAAMVFPAVDRYSRRMSELQTRLLQAGDPETAKTVQQEIDKIKPQVRLAGIKSGNLFATTNLLTVIEGNRMPTLTHMLPNPALGPSGGGDAPVDPSDTEGVRLSRPEIELWLTLNNPGHKYMPGQRAYVRFSMDDEPLAKRWTRRIWQLVQSRTRGKWT